MYALSRKEKNFQIINNNSERFNVKFVKNKTALLKNDSPSRLLKFFRLKFALCSIIPGANYTFQKCRCFCVYRPSITDFIQTSNKTG